MEKIEPGDKIRIISAKGEPTFDYINSIGEEYIVEFVNDAYNSGKKFLILKDSYLRPFLDNCELIRKRGQLEAADLKNGDIVEFRNKKRYIKTKNFFVDIETNELIGISHYDNYLFCSAFKDGSHDVMKILDMSEVYKNPKWSMEREERKVEEMTLEEVCKELGREIKIVREK
ncbi:MAG: hypothetical protein SPI94_04435 [Candidatus Onthovivens sp.]|nr:hypothetical protein [Candidatus Onthovivens sp.]